jgi:perosamine synthetase
MSGVSVTNLRIHFAKPQWSVEELDGLVEVWAGSRRYDHQPITNGGKVAEFEDLFAQFCKGGEAVAVDNCGNALIVALLALDIGPGDEVIQPALNHAAMANACFMRGVTPVFVDSHPDSGNLDPDLLEAALTPRTKAVGVVHYHGQPAYMRSTLDFCRRHNLKLIEDCALGLGTWHAGSNQHIGLMGDVGCFSFYPTKHITTGEGGMLLTKHPNLAREFRRLRSFGYGGNEDRDIIGSPSSNFRMHELTAACGVSQIQKAPGYLTLRLKNLSQLRKELEGLHVVGGSYALQLILDSGAIRDRLMGLLKMQHMETSTTYHRPVWAHHYYLTKYGRQNTPIADMFCYRGLTLPVGPHLDREKITMLADAIRKNLEKIECESRLSGVQDLSATIWPSA